jgi:phosphatidylglycerol:prolipoprotein diacylglycerol transferase
MHAILLKIGPITIGAYALMLTVAFAIGTLLSVRRGRRQGILAYEVASLVTVILLSSIIGSRILFVIEKPHLFFVDPWRVLEVWNGGFSYHGGLLLAILLGLWWCRRKRFPYGVILDTVAPAVALGFVFVRVGCYLNGCCFGTPTNLPWGVVFPPGSSAGWMYPSISIHPTQLYESMAGLVSFLVLLGLERTSRFSRGDGSLFWAFLTLSSSWRFILEFWRHHEPGSAVAGGLVPAQLYSIGILVFAAIMMVNTKRALCRVEHDNLSESQ